MASGRRRLRLPLADYGVAPISHRASRETLVLQMSSASPTRRAPVLTVYAALVFAFVYLPIVVLIAYSFNRDGVGGFPPRHFTLHWYQQLFGDSAIWDAVLNSLLVAAGSVALA